MQVYTFFKHDESGRVPSFDMMEFETDEAAENYALGLLAIRPNYRKVEVCDGLTKPMFEVLPQRLQAQAS